MNWNVQNTLGNRDQLVDKLLENRGIVSPKDKVDFLNPPPIKNLIKGIIDYSDLFISSVFGTISRNFL